MTTPTLRIQQPWAPWWIAIPMLIAYLAFGWVLIRDFNQQGQMVRFILPAYILFGAIVVPAAINRRFIAAGPEGVRVMNGPLPKGRNVFVPAQDIRSTSIRTQYAMFLSESGGSANIAHYLVGVEARGGHIDIAYPYLRYEDARLIASQIAVALGNGVPVKAAQSDPHHHAGGKQAWRRKVLLWGGLFLLAILAGAIWEIRSGGHTNVQFRP